MPLTLERIHEASRLVQENFYKKPSRKKFPLEIRGLFADIGRKIKKEGKTSVDLVREIRESK